MNLLFVCIIFYTVKNPQPPQMQAGQMNRPQPPSRLPPIFNNPKNSNDKPPNDKPPKSDDFSKIAPTNPIKIDSENDTPMPTLPGATSLANKTS